MKTKIFDQNGKEVSEVELNKAVFGLPWNADLVHQALRVLMANKRQVLASTKDRREVKGGGRKPWKQKGTGRARHGSIRSPLWRGGGITFGPTSKRNFKLKINKKMARKAFLTALSAKAKDAEILILDDLKLPAPKTREMAAVLKNFPKIKNGLLILPSFAKATEGKPDKNENIRRAAGNLPNLQVADISNLNVFDVLKGQYLIFTRNSVEYLNEKYGKK